MNNEWAIDELDKFIAQTVMRNASSSSDGPGKARLRRTNDDGSETYRSVQRGAMTFAGGPLSHEADHGLSEQEALEHLASLSVLAPWVDGGSVEAVA